MLALFVAAAALAQDPTVTSASDGTVTARVQVAASPEAVRAAFADSDAMSRLAPEVLAVKTAPKGECTWVEVKTEGAWSPLVYQAMRCPMVDGWKTELLQSDDFDGLLVTWKVTPDGTGSAIEYVVRTDLSMPLPKVLLQSHMEKSARATVMKLIERLVR